MRFAQQVRLATDKTGKDLDDLVKGAVLTLFQRVIIKTPVDKGTARNNWFCELGDTGTATFTRAADKSGNAALLDVSTTVSGLASGGKAILFNNLPYIERLEDGSSTQAPNGMVKTSLAEWPRIVSGIR
jgi:hypothetical protein